MFKKAVQRGRSERESEAYSLRYVEVLSDARTKREAFFNILLMDGERNRRKGEDKDGQRAPANPDASPA